MNDSVFAILAVVAAWWLSTGVVLRVVWLPRRMHRASLAIFTVIAVLGGYGLLRAASMPTVGGAYLGLASSLALWAWHELSFLVGVVCGPRREPCRERATGWVRFRDATATVIHHEIALAATMVAIAAATWGAPNQVATGTFLVLWVMRLSAKFNVFSGVRNLSEEFVPPHLRYLSSYFRRTRYNPLMLLSLGGGAVALAMLVGMASAADASRFTVVGSTLVSAMLALGLLEHVFLAVPLPDAMLWRWLIRGERETTEPTLLGADPAVALCSKEL